MLTALRIAVVIALLFVIPEGILRWSGYPKGTFIFLFQDPLLGLHPPHRDFVVRASHWPFFVHTNNVGFRGEDIAIPKSPHTFRIAAIGDSFTYGMNVDNDSTYPALLQQQLGKNYPGIEVVNMGRPGASLDNEYLMLKYVGLSLQPDLILLGFTSNDLVGSFAELDIPELIRDEPERDIDQMKMSLISFLLIHSALAEQVVERWLVWTTDGQFQSTRFTKLDDSRYESPEMLNHDANLELFRQKPQWEYVFGNPEKDLHRQKNNYETLLAEFISLAHEHDISVVLVLIPSYIQTYDPDLDFSMNNWLSGLAYKNHVAFLDGTLPFRQQSGNQPLYLLPDDVHMTPAGNKKLAEVIYRYLIDHPELMKANH